MTAKTPAKAPAPQLAIEIRLKGIDDADISDEGIESAFDEVVTLIKTGKMKGSDERDDNGAAYSFSVRELPAPDSSWLPPALRSDLSKPVFMFSDEITSTTEYEDSPQMIIFSVVPQHLLDAKDYLLDGIDKGLHLNDINVSMENLACDADYQGKFRDDGILIGKFGNVTAKFYNDWSEAHFNVNLYSALPVIELDDKAYLPSRVAGGEEIASLRVLTLKGESCTDALEVASDDEIEYLALADAPAEVVNQLTEMGYTVAVAAPVAAAA